MIALRDRMNWVFESGQQAARPAAKAGCLGWPAGATAVAMDGVVWRGGGSQTQVGS